VIELKNVSKNYGRVQALSDITFNVPKGKTIGILGPSGSGKTTLLRVIAGFEYPTSGQVMIDDDLASSPEYLFEPHRREISAVFQTPALWPNMTVAENINYVQPLSSPTELLDQIGITALSDRYPNELSGGEARRVSIIRALLADKRYLLLDEPLVNLNPELKEIIHQIIVEETQRRGNGVLYISHDASELEFADKIYVMSEGKIEEKQ
jgi:iron(III) transport system ATP-binding protein